MSTSRSTRRLRKQVDEPGLRASIVADVNVVVSTSDASSARSTVRVKQSTAAGTPGSPSRRTEGDTVSDTSGLSPEELEGASGEQLPDREQMSLVNANVAVPVNAAVAANVLSDGSIAYADASQLADIDQSQ